MSLVLNVGDLQQVYRFPQDVPVPAWLEKRKRDTLNLPIPSVCFVDPGTVIAGTAYGPYSEVDFDALNWNAWATLAQERRCAYCAHPLEYWITFVGHQHEVQAGYFMNPAMHEECAAYLCHVYPAVYLPRMRDRRRSEGGVLPTRLGRYKCREHKILRPPGPETAVPNYVIRAATRKDVAWTDYPRDEMAGHAARERERHGIIV